MVNLLAWYNYNPLMGSISTFYMFSYISDLGSHVVDEHELLNDASNVCVLVP